MTETIAAEALPSALIVAGAWHEPTAFVRRASTTEL
jgi:hypothetical protein